MSKVCPQCGNENPSAATFCMCCGILLNSELPKCPKCKEGYTEAADFCLHCGYAITDKAKKEQKIARSKNERELAKEVQVLKNELLEERETKNELGNKFATLKKLQIKLNAKHKVAEETINKLGTKQRKEIENQKQMLLKWDYIVFYVIAIIFLGILILVISGVL
ncbi:MAG: zinc ribbon domain-containing protein [Holosporaceae bacterium]|jgi:uncharacterized membrane protein YvbJ|nr:zinc ribbon domain-containing protein [Holosporaceae bacterium]